MILLVTSSARASEWIADLNVVTAEEIVLVETLAQGTAVLREKAFEAVIFDQLLAEVDPAAAEAMLEQAGMAIPLQVSLAICGMERLRREIRSAIRRREREEANAKLAAASKLYSEVNRTMTALLLCAESAFALEGLSEEAAKKFQSVYVLVKALRNKLASTESSEECEPTMAV